MTDKRNILCIDMCVCVFDNCLFKHVRLCWSYINTGILSISVCFFFFFPICFVLLYFPVSTIHLETASLFDYYLLFIAFIFTGWILLYSMHKNAFWIMSINEKCLRIGTLQFFLWHIKINENKLLITDKWIARARNQV